MDQSSNLSIRVEIFSVAIREICNYFFQFVYLTFFQSILEEERIIRNGDFRHVCY